MNGMAFDYGPARAVRDAGREAQFFASLEKLGFSFENPAAQGHFLLPEMAFDAPPQSLPVTAANGSIPWNFLVYTDPKTIQALVTPVMAAVIAGERGVGGFVNDLAQFKVGESTGESAAYGDYSRNGLANTNYNFPNRQQFRGQAFITYGDLEVEKAAEAKIDLPGDKEGALALTLAKMLNFIYNYGVGQLQNYGLLNDPLLWPPIQPLFSWLTNSSVTAQTIYQDFVRLFTQLQIQAPGLVRTDSKLVLAGSPENMAQLTQVTLYNTTTVLALIKQAYPNVRLETAPEYATASGQLVQLFAEEIEGQRTVECAFSTKMRSFTPVREVSSYSLKRATGAWGTIWYRRFLMASMLG